MFYDSVAFRSSFFIKKENEFNEILNNVIVQGRSTKKRLLNRFFGIILGNIKRNTTVFSKLTLFNVSLSNGSGLTTPVSVPFQSTVFRLT